MEFYDESEARLAVNDKAWGWKDAKASYIYFSAIA